MMQFISLYTVQLLLVVLAVLALYFAYTLFRSARQHGWGNFKRKDVFRSGLVGFFAYFMDTLGIGSFAIKTSFFKNLGMVEDRHIPGTLNVSGSLPILVEALIFVAAVQVEPMTLILCIASSVLGARAGVRVVTGLDEKKIQLGMSIALLLMGGVLLAGKLQLLPEASGMAIGLTGWKLAVAVVGSFVISTLSPLGIGAYAPMMVLFYLLGMTPLATFPIMMGASAIMLPAASFTFMKKDALNVPVAVGVTVFGIVGVLLAAPLVQSLNLDMLKWLLLVVVLYTSYGMYKSYRSKPRKAVCTE